MAVTRTKAVFNPLYTLCGRRFFGLGQMSKVTARDQGTCKLSARTIHIDYFQKNQIKFINEGSLGCVSECDFWPKNIEMYQKSKQLQTAWKDNISDHLNITHY
mmetsp:Transcript_58475/g.52697  ORF Transcript_58475/g.52697 Transcript_58475/m.52697 type:complete len:103 (+) Transcript_58475:57-365(+)